MSVGIVNFLEKVDITDGNRIFCPVTSGFFADLFHLGLAASSVV